MTDIVEKLRAEWVADVNSCPQCGADDTDQTDGLMREAANEIERLRKIIIRALNDYDQSDYPDLMDFEWVADAHKAIYPEISNDKR